MADRYSRALLTLIALLLVALLIEPFVLVRPVSVKGAIRISEFPAGPQRVELISDEPLKTRICDRTQCASLTPLVQTIGGVTTTELALLTASKRDLSLLDQPLKVQICDTIGSCVLLLPIGRASALAVSPLQTTR
jgi:hypothetical protein